MREWPVAIVSAFGRGETLALALHENGFKVEVFDFTGAFPAEYHRGAGPFPIVNKTYLPAQRDLLRQLVELKSGLSLWLKDGPMDLTGPMQSTHALSHPELAQWQAGGRSNVFGTNWLGRWLRQWASPYFTESWNESPETEFPVREPLGLLAPETEEQTLSFVQLMSKGVDVRNCTKLLDARVEHSRLEELELESGAQLATKAGQWIWCLSSDETRMLNEDVAKTLFWRGVAKPEWCWISFEGVLREGPWCDGLPDYSIVMGDEFLPWVYANTFILRRLDRTHFRVWLKVPRVHADNIDARRGWALGAENLLRSRLQLADWRIDSVAWSLCPNSEVFAAEARTELPGSWKNWDWISPETLPRLDHSARLESEAKSFARVLAWRNEQIKKQGAPRDQTLHAP